MYSRNLTKSGTVRHWEYMRHRQEQKGKNGVIWSEQRSV